MLRWLRRLWDRLMAWTTTTVRSSGFPVTAAVWNAELVNNMKHLTEVSYNQFIASVPITATTAATSNTVITATAFTAEAVPHMIEFESSEVSPNTGAGDVIHIHLFRDGVNIGKLARVRSPSAGTQFTIPVRATFRDTPSAGSRTYSVRAHVNTGTGSVGAGAGGADVASPGFIRIVRVPV